MLKSACKVLTAVGVLVALAPTAQAASRVISKDPECAALAVSVLPAPSWFAERCLGGKAVTESAQPQADQSRNPGDIAWYKKNFPAPLVVNTAPLPTLTFTQVGANANPLFGMAWNNSATTLYAVDNTARTLGTIDQTTGAYTTIGPITPDPAGFTYTGLTFDRTSTNVYFAATNGANATLYTINIASGAVTSVGPLTFPFTIDIAIDNTGQMYGHDISADTLIAIDKATGTSTVIGPTGLAANFAQGMMADPGDNTLYGCAFVTSPAQQGELVTFNKTTGTATVVAGPVPDEMECSIKRATGPPAPFIVYQSSAINDAPPNGNGNGNIDPNECILLNVTLRNSGSANATGISAILSTTTTGVTIAQANSAYPDIAAGATGVNTTPFQVSVAPTFVAGTPINFSMAVTTTQGPFTVTFSLPTGGLGTAMDFIYSGPPVPIPDNDPVGAFIDIPVSGLPGPVGKVTFTVYINHTWDGDLALTLAGPGGTPVDALSTNNGGSGDNYGTDCPADANDTTFDDAAATPITGGAPPYVGSFRPQSPLTVFNAITGNGTWRFKVVDNAGADIGNINCAKLSIRPFVSTPGPGTCGATGRFFTVTPCRVADTRNPPGPSGGPALAANTLRTFPVKGLCTIPTDATAVAISLAVVQETDTGDLRLFPAGGTVPLASTINFAVQHVRANNAIIPLPTSPTGGMSVQCDMPTGSTGTTHFLFDVYGYFK